MALLKINSSGFSGDTSNTSMILISFSRTIETEVIIAEMMISIIAITPGTKL